MKQIRNRVTLLALLATALFFSACSTTKTQNGVTIEQQRSMNLNPFYYIPSF